MNLEKFNERTSKPQFIYERSPVHEHSFLILQFVEEKNGYEPAGEYTVLDTSEDPEITEKKMINLVSLLNGRQDIMDLGNLTKTRLLFTIVPKTSESDKTKIIFRTFNNDGVSRENAVLTLEKGVINDDSNERTDP